MAKVKPNWIKAKAMYEAGKSLRDIAKVTFIDNSNISKKAKAEGWYRDSELPHLISDAVSVNARLTALDLPQLEFITEEIDKQVEGMLFYSSHARKVAKVAIDKLKDEPSIFGAKTAMATLKEGMIVEGLVPFYPNSTTINNSNAQQNNAVVRSLDDFYNDVV